jgi:hypothetical protein
MAGARRAQTAALSIGEGNSDLNRSSTVQVRIVDAPSYSERSRQAGANVLHQPTDHSLGKRQYDGLSRP